MTIEPPATTHRRKRRKTVSKKGQSGESEEEEEEDSCESDEEEDGEMACTGGCKGKWSRYSFEELDWNQDPLAEDGLWHAYWLYVCLCPHRVSSHFLFVLSSIVQCVQCRNWSHDGCVGREKLWATKVHCPIGLAGCVRDDVDTTLELPSLSARLQISRFPI